ncbi:MAG: tRNA (adenosine(37)-N6)-threonylcarbamoyltransferase complex dimerization subunit type 1 TsaB [Acidobacteria bacterium]|nr:tRNA (adenosine(37)-N6)-threonylcarbamoyltransferase complex dimerization subunit type 1 TsaB [Acidobacteriota bacterium]
MPVAAKPKVLAFDTSDRRGSIALLEGPELNAELKLNRLENHSASLIRSIDFLMRCLGWTLKDLNLVAVGTGPGSFTGIRIGIATGLGLAQSLSVPFAGISGMEALAFQARFLEESVGVVLNARRSQVYYAEYGNREGRIRQIRKPVLLFLADLQGRLKNRRLTLVGEPQICGVKPGKDADNGWPRAAETDLYLAASIGRRALSAKRRWKSGNSIKCEPLYIRPPDAIAKKTRTR